MNRAVFLDRDGVITKEPPHYTHKLSQLELILKCDDLYDAVEHILYLSHNPLRTTNEH